MIVVVVVVSRLFRCTQGDVKKHAVSGKFGGSVDAFIILYARRIVAVQRSTRSLAKWVSSRFLRVLHFAEANGSSTVPS